MKNTWILLLLLAPFGYVAAQSNCANYHRKQCEASSNSELKYDSQSKSTKVRSGQISEFHMVAYKGLDYKITFCSDEQVGEKVRYKIYQKKRQLMKDPSLMDQDVYKEEKISNEGRDQYADEIYETYVDSFKAYSDAYADDYSGDPQNNSSKSLKSSFRVVKELLYDNKDYKYENTVEFTAAGSMSLIVELIVPKSKSNSNQEGCIGILVEHMRSDYPGLN